MLNMVYLNPKEKYKIIYTGVARDFLYFLGTEAKVQFYKFIWVHFFFKNDKIFMILWIKQCRRAFWR